MARPRTFDDTDIRTKLLHQFWSSGFEGTSLPDLEEATGLSRKSLYNAFGDKREMFLGALQAFRRSAVEANTQPLRQPSASINAISDVLHGLADYAQTMEGRAGCMVCNTAREEIRLDNEIGREIDAYFEQLKDGFLRAVRNGQTSGEINTRPAEALAALCLGAVVSISVLSRAGRPIDELKAIAEETIESLR